MNQQSLPSPSPSSSVRTKSPSVLSVSDADSGDSVASSISPSQSPCSFEGPNCIEHPDWTFDDGNVTFLVGDTLFTVHKYFFKRDSTVFNQMFSLPLPQDEIANGSSRDHPIRLDLISVKDFDRFLRVLYPPKFGFSACTSADDWASVLDIADKYDFEDIRELAVHSLLNCAAPADLIVLGHRHSERRLLVSGYRNICNRREPLQLNETQRLDPRNITLIVGKREELLSWYSYKRNTADDENVESYFHARLPS